MNIKHALTVVLVGVVLGLVAGCGEEKPTPKITKDSNMQGKERPTSDKGSTTGAHLQ